MLTVRLRKEDPTIAEFLKAHGYATGQFGKNHLGDRDEYLPTMHGFDEFFGNLYHLNADEEPERARLSKGTLRSVAKFGPRGVLDCTASATDDATVIRASARWAAGCTDTGPLTKKRMETIDDDVANRAVDFSSDSPRRQAGLCVGEFHAHAFPHPRQAGERRPSGALARTLSRRHDRPRQECRHGAADAKDLGIDDNTFVVSSTDNGPHMNSWPDSAMTPFRSEKNPIGKAPIGCRRW